MASSPSSSVAPPQTLDAALAIIAQLHVANADLNQRGAAVQQALHAATAAAPRVAPRPKIPTPRPFDGTVGPAVDAWVDNIEKQFTFFQGYFANDAMKLEYAFNFVEPSVVLWYRGAVTAAAAEGTTIDTWALLVAAMRARYQPIESSFAARVSLDAVTQTGTVAAYSSYVQSKLTYITDMSPADQVHRYCSGLKPLIKIEVMKQKPTTISAAIQIAVGFEAFSKGVTHSPASGNPSAYRPHQQRSSYASASSAPMDVNRIEFEPEASSYLDSSNPRESHLLAVIQQQQDHQVQMQQQLNALFKKQSDRRSTPSSHSGGKIEGITREVYQRCRDEGVCLKCKEKGHNAATCTKPLRLNW